MNHDGNCFIFSLFILACYLVTPSSSCSGLLRAWNISITNFVPDDIVVQITSTDHDLGKHTISSNGYYYWTFCEKAFGLSRFTGTFLWGSKFQTLSLADREIMKFCESDKTFDQVCFWMVNPDGFFVTGFKDPPQGWVKKKTWE
ncbi:plant self-incompatibility S1 [Artemisia annua]|uniref:Plant self-incompatibility S1 n=1 Tax=Artemisia annua TaxID=35608 RepID=A0A2U1NAB1_ARTAN|nr:plant self-incompatibility S1 [Artemisia annua]